MSQAPIHNRRSIRLKGYDYTQPGAYLVTLVTQGRLSLFGEIVQDEMRVSKLGRIVQRAWLDLPCHYPYVLLDEFCLMPNHVHGIIVLTDDDGRGGSVDDPRLPGRQLDLPTEVPSLALETRPHKAASRQALSEVVRGFKSFSSRRINAVRHTEGTPVWQRNYYEHIIRNQAEWEQIRFYIRENLAHWLDDHEYISLD